MAFNWTKGLAVLPATLLACLALLQIVLNVLNDGDLIFLTALQEKFFVCYVDIITTYSRTEPFFQDVFECLHIGRKSSDSKRK